ncbi:DNA repair protein RadA [Candidatus Vondammii sp. HM_W22]|uniref:DNA repair protein RadA n=1 Tax=Candidatus Vondammii sp. HM_W22 TaxID=2687299 RepID=UPI001F130B4D|nr:DNA repair protein RadA [Candidatus Vondammii sp. HM_W22]
MAKGKVKRAFVCTDCGADYPTWTGQCTSCGEWNTVKEIRLESARSSAPKRFQGFAGARSSVQLLADVEREDVRCISSGMQELDRVLGGGFVPGSVILIGGDPGAGKSTILLQTLGYLSQSRPVLYVSGEESLQQIAERASRLGIQVGQLKMLAETSVEHICSIVDQEKPEIVVIDSIQVMQREGVDSAPGGVAQVRECAAYLTQYGKRHGVIFLISGHVTKDKTLAGQMTLSHIVDTQIMLSSTDDARYRLMRTTKNRFGSVNELGVFAMTTTGLKQVKNPSAIFLSRSTKPSPGSAVSVLWEGTRPLLVEIQSLVVDSQLGNPRRLGVGFDQNRVSMLLAVLTRHGGIVTSDQDVFINVVGGIRVSETSADLAVLLAIVSSLRDRIIPHDTIVLGEVGLSGELRPVANGKARIKDAGKHGFKKAIVPTANVPKKPVTGIEVIGVDDLASALDEI